MAAEPPSLADDLLARLAGSPDSIRRRSTSFARWSCSCNSMPTPTARRASSTTASWARRPKAPGAARARRRGLAIGSATRARSISSFTPGMSARRCVSRLLDETGVVLSLREPLPLRTLAEAHDALGRADSLLSESQFDSRSATFMRLWGRGYDDHALRRASRRPAAPAAWRRRFWRASEGVARDLHQPARRAVSGDAAGRAEFADRPARTRPRAHAAAAVAHRHAPLPPLHALSTRRTGGDELARGIAGRSATP